MFSFKVEAFRANFFDSSSVINAVDKATRKALSKFGAFVRTSARGSIRRRKGVSKPGQPPYAHQGDIKEILFAYDSQSKSVVIGPVKKNIHYFGGDGFPTKGLVTTVLEHGGSITVKEVYGSLSKKWYRKNLRVRRGWQEIAPQRMRTVNIMARPFMNPALMKNLPQLPELWRNQVHR